MKRLILITVTLMVIGFPTSSSIKGLWDIPFNNVNAKTVKSYNYGLVQVKEIKYQSRNYKDKPVWIFGYYVYPKNKNNLPAILLVHGGGGSAHLGRAANWAKRGYAVLVIDLPGKGEQRATSRSTGPNMDVPSLLKVWPELTENYLVHAVAATRNGITYLTQQSEVDPDRIGMVGLSWGGVITLLTNGQDTRLKTAVNVFGAGYIPEGCTWQDRFSAMTEDEIILWDSYIDPKNFLKTQHAPILFITGTNDHCYYLPTFQKSYEETLGIKNIYLVPNLRHRFLADTQRVVWRWLDIKLKKPGSFPKIDFKPAFYRNEKLIIPVVARSESKITKATLFYTPGQPSEWTRKAWKGIDAYYEDGIHYFGIPLSLISPNMLFFINIYDANNGAASIPIRSILKIILPDGKTTYAVSSPIEKTYVNQMPFQFIGDDVIPKFKRLHLSKKDKAYKLIKSPKMRSLRE
jgi:cephalosporin-C deacetylase-like acetyl esterase